MNIQQLIDTKVAVTAVASILSTVIVMFSSMFALSDQLTDKLYAKVTEPAHTIVRYDLLKQLEKLNKDPDDIKHQDVLKFNEFCGSYFGTTYAPKQQDGVALGAACDKIQILYLASFGAVE
jgi:hypothetical protein